MKKIIKRSGFTLVELLIVIALIAILSVAVLATINPIEQSNKARDASFKNDAAEVLGAYERYYASTSRYPWGVGTSTVVIPSNTADFGVIGAGGSDGALVSTSELKASFANKKPFKSDTPEEDMLYAYHNATTNDNYVCYFPKAKANRDPDTTGKNLKCIDTATTPPAVLDVQTSEPADTDCQLQDSSDDWSYTPDPLKANAQCVPEGDISN